MCWETALCTCMFIWWCGKLRLVKSYVARLKMALTCYMYIHVDVAVKLVEQNVGCLTCKFGNFWKTEHLPIFALRQYFLILYTVFQNKYKILRCCHLPSNMFTTQQTIAVPCDVLLAASDGKFHSLCALLYSTIGIHVNDYPNGCSYYMYMYLHVHVYII